MGPDERRGDGQTSTRTGIAATTRSHAKACDVLLHCVLAREEGGDRDAGASDMPRSTPSCPSASPPFPCHTFICAERSLSTSLASTAYAYSLLALPCVYPTDRRRRQRQEEVTHAHERTRGTHASSSSSALNVQPLCIYIYIRVCVCALGTFHLICATLPTTHRQMPYRGVHPQRSRRRQKGQAWGTEEWNR